MNTKRLSRLTRFSPFRARVATSCLAVAMVCSAALTGLAAEPKVALKEIASGFVAPTIVTSLADGSGRLLIGDQVGTVSVVEKDGKLSQKLFLDLRSRMVALKEGFTERGLLGLALHPQFRQNGRVYVVYSAPLRQGAPADWDHTMHLSEFKVGSDKAQVDLSTERVIHQVDKPYDNHNCGRIAFGPDGYLYFGVGDGGAAHGVGKGHSPKGNGQDLTNPLGKILRIDVNKGEAGRQYAIPSDNPFVKGGGLPEIYAYGLRNPWGISFDRGGAHELFAADVGQGSFEEVNIIVKGGNYGWNRREGFVCFDPTKPNNPPADCPKVDDDGKPFTDPILAYKNFGRFPKDPESKGISITGGFVYRGKALPKLNGKYVFGDWSRAWVKADGVLYVATRPESSVSREWKMGALDVVGATNGGIKAYIWAFGEDEEGELYVLTNTTNGLIGKNGKVWKLVPEQ